MKVLDVVKIIINSTYVQTLNCIRYDLHCLDPPSVTSGMLDRYGIETYAKKLSFWKTVDIIISKYNNIALFKGRFGVFELSLNHDIEEVYKVENSDIYVDSLDCNYLNCVATPRSHTLRIYLEGMYGERVILRINIVTLLKLAIVENPYFRECLDEFVVNPLSLETITRLANCALGILSKHKSIYELLFSKHAKNATDVLKHSPFLKKYLIRELAKEDDQENQGTSNLTGI
ncbi:MAG: hypothetical protein QW775_03580 [Ignisphaera sp.]|uniref:Uncharacterized protein n=1 Tax=Ignisphaera aggregans TaxID=334771 RepID=A0A7C4NNE9_9CREN